MKPWLRLFSLYLFLIGISAVFGGWAIIYTDFMHFPPDLLQTTPFHSFIIPGIILAGVVGGTQFLAALLLWLNNRFMYEASALAGFCLLLWMSTEIYMIPSHHPVQIVYLGLAMITLLAVMLLLTYQPAKR